jgi:hypothetical protein
MRNLASGSRLSAIPLRSAGWPLRRCSIARKMRSNSRSSPSVGKSFVVLVQMERRPLGGEERKEINRYAYRLGLAEFERTLNIRRDIVVSA